MTLEYNELKALLESIRLAYGYDFTDYAETSLRRRSVQFMNARKIESFGSLSRILLTDEKVFEEFIQNISVTVTEMFRDPLFYKSLRENVIKQLATYPFIKIWLAGCATGEEAYSLAILLKEEGMLDRSLDICHGYQSAFFTPCQGGHLPAAVHEKLHSQLPES